MKEEKTLYMQAKEACLKVAEIQRVTEEERRNMLDAARQSPHRALACYTAILNTYKEI